MSEAEQRAHREKVRAIERMRDRLADFIAADHRSMTAAEDDLSVAYHRLSNWLVEHDDEWTVER